MTFIPTTTSEWIAKVARTREVYARANPPKSPVIKPADFAQIIDHTLLSLSATESDIDTLCAEAREAGFATVCVRPNYVSRAVQNLRGSSVGLTCVIGFHEGTYSTEYKVAEAKAALANGATELDMVINYWRLRAMDYHPVYLDILAVKQVCAQRAGTKLKVILETSQLDQDGIMAGCVIACYAGADFVKTSTGFNGPGADVESVSLMLATVDLCGEGTKVKASGGIKTAQDCAKMIQAGATRIGTSSGVRIVNEALQGETEKASKSDAPGAVVSGDY
ncbi:hypothetical protein FQN57_004903 [Myotisia sp. PD_48]|nr:hypothetical protein FQN57_004903 [Myotisia sp. PD_48]